MAEKKASLILEVKDLFSQGIGNFVDQLGKVRAGVLAAGTAVAGLTKFLTDCFKAYMDQENANNRLNQALKNQGIYTKSVSEDLIKYASEIQKTTTFTDEAASETLSLLTTFGLQGDELKRTTKAAIDLSVGLGVDLHSASVLLGKAFQGQTESLGRYGIVISKSIPENEKFSAVMEQLNTRFGGSAAAQLNTHAGQIQNMTNRLGELKEKIGAELVPVVEFWTKALEKAVGWLEKLTGATNNDLAGRELTIQKLKEEQAALIEKSTVEGTYHSETMQRRLENYQDAIQREQDLLAREEAAENKRKGKSIAFQQFQARQREEEAKANQKAAKEKDDLITKLDEKLEKQYKEHIDKQQKWREDQDARDRKANEERFQNLQSTLSNISSLSSAHNKTLAAIGKAGAISTATIDTYAAANKALASAPPPWNFALMAAVITAGIANVARISGIRLAEGGIVMPAAGGVQATIAEAGRAEAVIPLDDPRTRDKMAAAGLGGNVTIQVGMMIADDTSIKELARKIDKALYDLRRNGETVAI